MIALAYILLQNGDINEYFTISYMSMENNMKEKLVLVGNGMAGMRTIEELLKIAPDKYDITVFGAEPYGNYNRILLSPVLAGEQTIDDIMLNDLQWYADNHITLHTNTKVTRINRKKRMVITDDGVEVEYDRLLLATGSNPFVIPIPGHDAKGVISFRDIADVDTMLEAAKTKQHAVVIGGGLLGLEAANGLMKQGMQVTVVHLMDWLMERQLDEVAAGMLKRSLEAKGMEFLLQTSSSEILKNEQGEVTGIQFADGAELTTDLIVMAVGIRPNIELAQSAGIHCEQGIIVNDTLQTFDPKIYAVGECVQHRGVTYGLVAPLFEMAKVCANHLAEYGIGVYKGSVTSTKLKVTGIDLFSAGDFIGDDTTENIMMYDESIGVYKKLVIKDNKIQGAVLYGDTIDGAWYFQLMREAISIKDMRQSILFGQAHIGDSGHGGTNAVSAMDDSVEICGCNGVTKGDIVKAITAKGLFTLEEVRAHTKASSSCGSCTGLVEQLMESTLGGDYTAPELKPLCGCTDYTDDQVREEIVQQHLTCVKQVMQRLQWKNADGCAKCRPALNYYVISSWHNEAQDDYQSRFINERVHANIQKDGSYSVVPRLWGGVVNPDELRAIADAAEKFDADMHITGGQRIDLFGLKKEELPLIWKDLNDAGLVSGHAYGKALRTVKTCVGQQWCRFGTQDSTTMGVKLEKMTWGSWTPHKFKMAVSGCPRNCAEATIKDFGVVAVDSGWELHVGGNGGIKVRVTDLLCKVDTEEEVLEYAAAFMQIYREQARYLERTAPWIERVGLSYVQEQIVDDVKNRQALYARFLESQKISQQDPWTERSSNNVDAHEFTPLKVVSGS